MRWIEIGDEEHIWSTLEVYRERYDLEDHLEEVERLRRSIDRRHARWLAIRRRAEELEAALAEARAEVGALEEEISGSRRTGGLLIGDILERVRSEQGEMWSPTPILGFRVWEMSANGVRGARLRWDGSVMRARCLNSVPGEDLPHSSGICGPPACGIYATKDPVTLIDEFRITDERPALIGVVALGGKVIEHEHGYRAAAAEVLAISGWSDGRLLTSDSPTLIDALFGGSAVFSEFEEPRTVISPVRAGADYLNRWKELRETWTWEPRFASSR